MATDATVPDEYDINPATYDWSIRIFRTLKKLLSVRLRLHAEEAQIREGDIFLFNHFSRFETFIPQYLIYEKTGEYCCSVASSEFFEGDATFANFLRSVGAIPHNHERLLPLLAEQVLRGRKVIIFPEGGMVKDRRVIDKFGQYSIYSRTAMDRRKQHTGAGVLGLGVDIFKMAVRLAEQNRRTDRLESWARQMKFEDVDTLLAVAERPTFIIPANITFYPIRVSANFLNKGVELLSTGLTRRHSEELLIESNIILKETDLDIRLAEPVNPRSAWRMWEKVLLRMHGRRIDTLDEVFVPDPKKIRWHTRLLRNRMRQKAKQVRNEYMHKMYSCVTVNMSHLASSLIMQSLAMGREQISRETFQRALYLAVKRVQRIPQLYRHESIEDPTYYDTLIGGDNKGLDQYISIAESAGLIEPLVESAGPIEPVIDYYRFLPKLTEEHDFDDIRMENLVVVYDNEIAPIPSIARNVAAALEEVERLDGRKLAEHLFDDELISWRVDKAAFSEPRHAEINRQETATRLGAPFFLPPKHQATGIGVILIHGMLASPAEVYDYGRHLSDRGYTVLGVRLKGHGTSPWDLRERSWEDWYESLARGYRIMCAYTDKILLVGFSTGGALALRFAAEQPDGLIGVAALAVPIKFRDSRMMYIPLLHGTNKLLHWLSSYEGIKPFFQNIPEHGDINYRSIPVRALYELRRLIDDLQAHLTEIHCPTLILQGDNDPIVAPESAQILVEKMQGAHHLLLNLRSDRHGVLLENIDNCQRKIDEFIAACHSPDLGKTKDFFTPVQVIENKLSSV